ncbi:hypothetical protein B0A52_09587 [Exophiala mesophila]|uniref:HTH myb-type domain-containing protein n=1 Tax=Exophiala mesophila TaxID=212818 RepID=A0A438MT71_EXOME|nr:hypothetical protein B0A52_09587 [Exophiala mesophila]
MSATSPPPLDPGGNLETDPSTLSAQPPAPSSTPVQHAGDDDKPRSPKRRRLSPAEESPKPAPVQPVASTSEVPSRPSVEPSKNNATIPPSTVAPSAPPAAPQPSHVTNTVPTPQIPSLKTRIDNLAALDRLSLQILALLAKLTPAEAMGLSNTPDSPRTREYTSLRSQFEYTRRLYNTGAHFLSPRDLGLQESSHVDVLRRANQAIFVSSVFTGQIGLRDMDRSFLAVFVPEGGKLLKAQASIYLELKTQGFITAWRTRAAPPSVVMVDLFGTDIDKSILSRRPGTSTLASSEVDFLNRLASRRDILQNHVKTNTLEQLPLKYKWEDFSREVSSYLAKNIEGHAAALNGIADPTGSNASQAMPQGSMEGQFSMHVPPLPTLSHDPFLSVPQDGLPTFTAPEDDFVAQAARAAEIAMQDALGFAFSEPVPPATSAQSHTSNVALVLPKQTSESQHHESSSETAAVKSSAEDATTPSDIPHVSQTAPTSVLYERARLVATTKAQALPARKGVVPSQRRPWTTEEENALMTGLDRVKGPHWSQILAMYGPGGTISEALKDRNQVQLKDKARNLKLFFLKSGIEVPYYLKYVTGDLRTRAPGHPLQTDGNERENGPTLDEAEEQELLALASSESQSAQQSPTIEGLDMPPPPISDKPLEPSMDDVEAMIARAAAQAAQSLGPDGWP